MFEDFQRYKQINPNDLYKITITSLSQFLESQETDVLRLAPYILLTLNSPFAHFQPINDALQHTVPVCII